MSIVLNSEKALVIAVVCILLDLCLAGCEPGASSGSDPRLHRDPHMLVQAYQQALLDRDLRLMPEYVDPAARGDCERLAGAHRQFREEALKLQELPKLQELLKQNFSERDARLLREAALHEFERIAMQVFFVVVDEDDDPVYRRAIELVPSDQGIVLVAGGYKTEFLVIERNGHWYVSTIDLDDWRAEMLTMRRQLGVLSRRFRNTRRAINEGWLDAAHLESVLSLSEPPPSGPPRD